MFSDFRFHKGVDDSVRLLSNSMTQPIYYYYYCHRSPYSLATLMGGPLEIDLGTVTKLTETIFKGP